MINDKQTIMMVDDNMASLTMGKNILKDKYNAYPIPSGEKLFEIMEKISPDLILLDVSMPDMDGYDIIQKLKTSRKTQNIPVIFLTSKDEPENELTGLSLGAIDYIHKPFSPALLIQRIENHLLLAAKQNELVNHHDELIKAIQEQASDIEEFQYAVMSTLAEVVEFRSGAFEGHIKRTQGYLKIFMEKMIEEKVYTEETSKWNLDFMIPSALLHDVGKIMIKEDIISKPGKLSPEEFEQIKKHPEHGIMLIDHIINRGRNHAFLEHARVIAASHHEWWNGSGYPAGLSGNVIPLQGRIMAIVDVYDSLVASRPHKKPMSPEEAENIIIEGKGTQFDPQLIEVFKKAAPEFAKYAAEESRSN